MAALTLWGPRTQADAAALASYVAEAEGGDPGELTKVFEPIVERWQALEVIDDGPAHQRRLVGIAGGVRPRLGLSYRPARRAPFHFGRTAFPLQG